VAAASGEELGPWQAHKKHLSGIHIGVEKEIALQR